MITANAIKYKSDPTLMTEIRTYGKFNTNACLQCGSCTISCDLTNNSTTFPRRTIQYALMGLRNPLIRGLEPWLCYYCGDCSATCPRQTEPGEAMMTFRRYLTAQYDWTGLASKIYRSKIWEIGSLLVIGFFVLFLIGYYHINMAALEYDQIFSEESITETFEVYFDVESPQEYFMGHMFNSESKLAQTFVTIVFLFPLVILLSNASRMYWFTMHKGNDVSIPFRLYLTEAKTLLVHGITQKRFKDCTDKNRWIKHMLLVGACVLMFGIKLFFLAWFQTDEIYAIYHPQRWLGYLAAAILIYVTIEILLGRIRKNDQIQKFSELSDWTLPILLLLTAVSGMAVHICRYLEFSMATHYLYALHLAIVVPMLVIEIPFGKLAHIIYRPLAIYFQAVKDKAVIIVSAEEPDEEEASAPQKPLNKEEIQVHVE